jgi:hypothetical protein
MLAGWSRNRCRNFHDSVAPDPCRISDPWVQILTKERPCIPSGFHMGIKFLDPNINKRKTALVFHVVSMWLIIVWVQILTKEKQPCIPCGFYVRASVPRYQAGAERSLLKPQTKKPKSCDAVQPRYESGDSEL